MTSVHSDEEENEGERSEGFLAVQLGDDCSLTGPRVSKNYSDGDSEKFSFARVQTSTPIVKTTSKIYKNCAEVFEDFTADESSLTLSRGKVSSASDQLPTNRYRNATDRRKGSTPTDNKFTMISDRSRSDLSSFADSPSGKQNGWLTKGVVHEKIDEPTEDLFTTSGDSSVKLSNEDNLSIIADLREPSKGANIERNCAENSSGGRSSRFSTRTKHACNKKDCFKSNTEEVFVQSKTVDSNCIVTVGSCEFQGAKRQALSDSDEQSTEDDIQIISCIPPDKTAQEQSSRTRSQLHLDDLSEIDLRNRLRSFKNLRETIDLSKLPDEGRSIFRQIEQLEVQLAKIKEKLAEPDESSTEKTGSCQKKYECTIPKGPAIIAAHTMNKEEKKQLLTGQHNLFGGKMTATRVDAANIVRGNVIATMHRSLSSIPENVKTETPLAICTELQPHQQEGLTWLLWREKQTPHGGILADDMGLGKTLSMISLIAYMKKHRKDNLEEWKQWKKNAVFNKYLIDSKATLIIVPASLLFQWEAEIQKHVKSGCLKHFIYHGTKLKRTIHPRGLADYDIVITTYGVLTSELGETRVAREDSTGAKVDSNGKSAQAYCSLNEKEESRKSVLLRISWDRIILDEAHQIKNKGSLVSRACCKLPAASRWCLTGTPIHNNLWDLYSLIRFLRVTPFDEEAVWKEYIMCGRSSSQRLNTLIKGLLLRREKNQLSSTTQKPIVSLKPKMYETRTLALDGLEKKVYDYMYRVSRQRVKELISTREQKDAELYGLYHKPRVYGEKLRNPFLGGPRTVNQERSKFQTMCSVLTLLMRLRQACVHLALTRKAIDLDAFETISTEEKDLADLSLCMENMSLTGTEALASEVLNGNCEQNVEKLFEATFLSTKVKILLKGVEEAVQYGDKCVIVSQWTSLLDILEYHLDQRSLTYTAINGKIPTKERQSRVESFNDLNGGPKVMLLSLTAGGVGLNLIGGNHLFLVDLHWNPALEQQACDRIYRIGQSKNVFVHKLVCGETIEERVLALQTTKTAMAKSVLEGVASKKLTKLTMADLEYLFELGRPQNKTSIAYTSGKAYNKQ